MNENEWVRLRRSGIHGKGLFARKAIPEGTRILEYVGEKITKGESQRRALAQLEYSAGKKSVGAVYIFQLNKRHDIDGNFPGNLAKHANHSCDPNCETQIIRGKIWMIALRDIAEGEELVYNYGFDMECWDEHPCRCGTSRCMGFIVAEEYWPELRRKMRRRGLRRPAT